MGNTLDRPTMLMKKNFIQNTETLDENLKEGTTYKKMNMQKQEIQEASSLRKAAPARKMKMAKAAYNVTSSGGSGDATTNKIKDYQNFLS